jgi:hypothetical protein
MTLTNLGVLHATEHRYGEARKAYDEALAIYAGLAATSPERFGPDLERVQDLIGQLPK